jgi:predicted nucleic acid-binding protein
MEKNAMETWLIDPALFKTLATPSAKVLKQWFDANNASIYLSALSLTELSAAVSKTTRRQPQRGQALQFWLDGLTYDFADRIHAVDAEISLRAGLILPRLTNGLPRHLEHDAIYVATAQVHGHGLLTRREAIFSAWTQTPIAII